MGVFAALLSYIIWGLSTIFWKQLSFVSADVILSQRIIWSFVFVSLVIIIKREFKDFLYIYKKKKVVGLHLLSGFLLAGNWLTFVYAVNNGFIVDASLGYFINPLVSIFLGLILLKEKARPLQIVAIVFALLGVMYITYMEGRLPWISLMLAFSFGFYGYLRKKSALESLHGLALETSFFVLFALVFTFPKFDELYLQNNLISVCYLIGTGAITAIPLLLFAYAARKISLITVGILQYLAPIIQLFVGILIYDEKLSHNRLITFIFVWSALLIYTIEAIYFYKQKSMIAKTL